MLLYYWSIIDLHEVMCDEIYTHFHRPLFQLVMHSNPQWVFLTAHRIGLHRKLMLHIRCMYIQRLRFHNVNRRLIDLQKIPSLCMYVCVRSINNTEAMTRVQTKYTQEFQMLWPMVAESTTTVWGQSAGRLHTH